MIEKFPRLLAALDRWRPFPLVGSNTAEAPSREEAERRARELYARAAGKIIRVHWLCGYNEHDDSEDIYPEGGVLVRVTPRTAAGNPYAAQKLDQDIVRWMDAEHLDPTWDVEPVEAHPALEGRRSFWFYAPSYRVPRGQ